MAILYAVMLTTPNVPDAHYVAKPVLGDKSQYVQDARTWKTESGALGYVAAHPEILHRGAVATIVRVERKGRIQTRIP